MSAEFCPRPDCGKKLDYTGESWVCRHCGFHDCMPAMGKPITRAEIRSRVQKHQAVKSGSCRGQFHERCTVATCPCWCHDPKQRRSYAAQLRREAAEIEARLPSTDADVYRQAKERAEELRRRADEVES